MLQEQTSLNWIRKGKVCALTKKSLAESSFHFSALLETEKGVIRLDIHEEVFARWKSDLKDPLQLLAWWRVSTAARKQKENEILEEGVSFSRFYEAYVQNRPDLVLRLALLLQKMKVAHVERIREGWRITLKEDSSLDEAEMGQWQLPPCKLSQSANKQQEDNELIRLFFAQASGI